MDARMSRPIPSSFRDPSGFLFFRDNLIYRQVNSGYRVHYDALMQGGLYEVLTRSGFLIPHDEGNASAPLPDVAYKVIKPHRIPFISYPYEWCFSQLKDAALATLAIQKTALQFGMSLKDCSAYNIQFYKGKPILIDTLSFEKYREGEPWVAYRQFCQHFLAPLALMSYTDIRLNQLLRIYIDGIPLDLATSLLPSRARFSFALFTHLYLHAKSQAHFADKAVARSTHRLSRLSFMGLVDSLEGAVRGMRWQAKGTEWGEYYTDTNYTPAGLQHKREIVSALLDKARPGTVWDLGANTGMFSRLASEKGAYTISMDSDPAAVEKNYLQAVDKKEDSILPLVIDLTNPSPAIGWENNERMSLFERGPADMALALALVHHLAISNNLPFSKIVDFFKKVCRFLIIEFIPKDDAQVQRLLRTREDIFPDYTQEAFEVAFSASFVVKERVAITDSKRAIYLMKAKEL